MKFSIKDFFCKCDQIRRKLEIWSHLLKKFLIENFLFGSVYGEEHPWENTCEEIKFLLYSENYTQDKFYIASDFLLRVRLR